jgi:hypothetical protein
MRFMVFLEDLRLPIGCREAREDCFGIDERIKVQNIALADRWCEPSKKRFSYVDNKFVDSVLGSLYLVLIFIRTINGSLITCNDRFFNRAFQRFERQEAHNDTLTIADDSDRDTLTGITINLHQSIIPFVWDSVRCHFLVFVCCHFSDLCLIWFVVMFVEEELNNQKSMSTRSVGESQTGRNEWSELQVDLQFRIISNTYTEFS